MSSKLGILLDLDNTLVITEALKPLRQRRDWAGARQAFSRTQVPKDTAAFLADAAQLGQIGIVTRTPREAYAEPLLRHHHLEGVQVLVAYNDLPANRQKPKPDPILLAAEILGCAPHDCVYIGDEWSDMEAAQSAGATPIGISWPNLPGPERKMNALRICTSWSEVIQVIRTLKATRPPSPQGAEATSNEEMKWIDNRLSIFDYHSHRYSKRSNTQLVYWFKNHDRIPSEATPNPIIQEIRENAFSTVVNATVVAMEEYEPILKDDLGCAYIVSAPSSKAGMLSCDNPCERLAAVLEATFPWLMHLPAALERTVSVRSSHLVPDAAHRCTVQEHLDSICYVGPELPTPVGGIILLDDVFTLGATSDACRTILQQATGCSTTVGLFVGRTVDQSPGD